MAMQFGLKQVWLNEVKEGCIAYFRASALAVWPLQNYFSPLAQCVCSLPNQ